MIPNFFIYNASAGSGKTYNLVKNFLRLLLKSNANDTIKHILAVTFTNKAAEEMKERILFRLQELANNLNKNFIQELSIDLDISTEELLQRAQKNLSFILHNYSCFNVSTIDKFNLRILKSFAKELQLSSSFSIDMETEKYLKETIEILLEELGKKSYYSDVMLEYAMHNLENKKAADFSKNLVKHSLEFLNENNISYINNLKDYNEDFYSKLKQKIKNRISKNSKKIVYISNLKLQEIDDLGLQTSDFSGGKNGIAGYFEKAKINKIGSIATIYKIIEEDKTVSSTAKNKEAHIIQILPNLIHSFYEIEEIRKEVILDKDVFTKIFMLEMNTEITKILIQLKKEKDIIFIHDFNTILSTHIQNQPIAFIYEKLGSKFQHYFFDEFQDTSQMQWNNFLPLIDHAKASEKHSVTLVGDPKQSIYRFRAGNPEIMLDLINEASLDEQMQVISLPKNYRSFNNIVDFNNRFYPFISTHIEDVKYKNIFQHYSFQQSQYIEKGRVQFSFYNQYILDDNDKKTEELNVSYFNRIVSIIKECTDCGFQLKDIVILVKKNKIIKKITPFLLENNIDFITEEALYLSNSIAIQTIIYYLQWEKNINDKESFINFLYNLYKLKIITPKDFTEDSLYFLQHNVTQYVQILKTKYNISLYNLDKNNLQFLIKIEKIFKALHIGKDHAMYIAAFLDLILEQESYGTINTNDFLIYWNEKGYKKGISFPKNTEAIKLMTIHKSKGLEFPVVIYPVDNSNNMTDKFWMPLPNDKYNGLEHYYTGINEDFENFFNTAHILKQTKNNETLIDEYNLHYVATTRAIEQLYILDEPHNESLFSHYIQDIGIPLQEVIELYTSNNNLKIYTHKDIHIIEEKVPWISENWEHKIALSTESIVNLQKAEERKWGNFIHLILSKIKTIKNLDIVLKSAINKGELLQMQLEKIHNLFTTICNHSEISYLYEEDCAIYNERDFLIDNETIRPDRLVQKQNKYYLIDYKTGNYEEKHKFQLQYYQEQLNKISIIIEKKYLVYLKDDVEVIEV